MAGRIVYTIFGTIVLILGVGYASDPPRSAPNVGMVLGLAGIGLMIGAMAFGLAENAAARRYAPVPYLPPPPPVPPPPYQAAPMPYQSNQPGAPFNP